jgi:hypothetical protein
MLLGVAPGIVMFAPLIKVLFVGLTPQLTGVVMIFPVMLLGLLVPLIDFLSRRLQLPWISLAIGISFLVTGSVTSGFDTHHPRPDNLIYAVDGSTGNAFWLSHDKSLDEWTRTFFPGNPERRPVPEIFGDKSMSYWFVAAPKIALPAPTIEKLDDSTTSTTRKINFKVRSLRHAPKINLSVEGVGVISSKVNGRLFSQVFRSEWGLNGFGIPEEGINIELNVQANSPFKVRVIDITYELPQASWQPRPHNLITQPFGLSDTSIVAKTVDF